MQSRTALLWITAIAAFGLVGCFTAQPLGRPNQAQEPNDYAKGGPTVSPRGVREWQLQTLKELHDVTVKYDDEKTRRVAAENKLARYEVEGDRLKGQQDRAAAALAAAEKRIAELETQHAAAQSASQAAQREQELMGKKLLEAQARSESEKARADGLEDKLMRETSDHMKTKTQLLHLQIEQAKQAAAALNGKD